MDTVHCTLREKNELEEREEGVAGSKSIVLSLYVSRRAITKRSVRAS